ncbi:hypothetical protein VTK56DRAFT_6985 [Thermocarpiscus australiensis]
MAMKDRGRICSGPGNTCVATPERAKLQAEAAAVALHQHHGSAAAGGHRLGGGRRNQMPNSDNSARFLGIHPNASQPVRFARAVFTNTSASAVADTLLIATALSTTSAVITAVSTAPGSSLTASGQPTVLVHDSPVTDSFLPTSSTDPDSVPTQSSARTTSLPTRVVPSVSASSGLRDYNTLSSLIASPEQC